VLLLVVTLTCARAADEQPVGAQRPAMVVAVAPFDALGADGVRLDAGRAVAQAMADLISSQLSEAPGLTLVERVRIDQVLSEQSLALSGLLDPSTAVRVGRLLKADVVIVGRIRSLAGAQFLATLRAIAVADAHVLWSGEAQGTDARLIGQSASLAADVAASVHPVLERAGTGPTTTLTAAKHHERAAALRALGAPEEAATEELLALRADPSLAAADLGFITALADAGFGRLAAAEAQRALTLAKAGGAAVPGALIALAARDAMPTATVHEDREDDPEVLSLLRITEIMAAHVGSAAPDQLGATQRDYVRSLILLGNAYVDKRQDHKARALYHQALALARALRARDISTAHVPSFRFPEICDSAAARALEETAVRSRSRDTVPTVDIRLLTAVAEAVAQRQGLPDGALPPLPIYQLVLPIAERVMIPDPEHGTRMTLLVRIDWKSLPAGTEIVAADIAGVATTSYQADFVPVSVRWVAAEATAVWARAEVPWPASGAADGSSTLGRTAFMRSRNGPMRLLECLQESLLRRQDDHGMAVLNAAASRPATMPDVRIRVDLVCPLGTVTTLTPSVPSRISLGVYALIGGDRAAARRQFAAISAADLTPGDAIFPDAIPRLIALCGDTP
jgi:tetratricopeptide (TPR) repeat protein